MDYWTGKHSHFVKDCNVIMCVATKPILPAINYVVFDPYLIINHKHPEHIITTPNKKYAHKYNDLTKGIRELEFIKLLIEEAKLLDVEAQDHWSAITDAAQAQINEDHGLFMADKVMRIMSNQMRGFQEILNIPLITGAPGDDQIKNIWDDIMYKGKPLGDIDATESGT